MTQILPIFRFRFQRNFGASDIPRYTPVLQSQSSHLIFGSRYGLIGRWVDRTFGHSVDRLIRNCVDKSECFNAFTFLRVFFPISVGFLQVTAKLFSPVSLPIKAALAVGKKSSRVDDDEGLRSLCSDCL